MKNLCTCKCGTRIQPRNNRGWRAKSVGHFAPGHNQFHPEGGERMSRRKKHNK